MDGPLLRSRADWLLFLLVMDMHLHARKSKFVTKGYEINLRAKVDKQSMDRAYLSLGTRCV